jgi:hypothetical protein
MCGGEQSTIYLPMAFGRDIVVRNRKGFNLPSLSMPSWAPVIDCHGRACCA